MLQFVFVFVGSGLGGLARFLLGGSVLHHTSDWRFPLSTFVVNVVGCLAAGLLAGLVERWGWFTADVRVCLFAGLLGGFTTFSAFSLETMFLLRRGHVGVALTYVGLSICCGLAAMWMGTQAIPRS